MMHYRALHSIVVILVSWQHLWKLICFRLVLTATHCESEWRAACTTTPSSHSCSGVACRRITRVTANQLHHKKMWFDTNSNGNRKAEVTDHVSKVDQRTAASAKQGRNEKAFPAEWQCPTSNNHIHKSPRTLHQLQCQQSTSDIQESIITSWIPACWCKI